MFGPEALTFFMIAAMVAFLVMGYPVAFVLGGLATIFGLLFIGPSSLGFFVFKIYGIFADYLLVAVPLFVFMGMVIDKSGLAIRLYDATHVLMGRLPGGLAVATIVTSTIFAAATGVVGASVITMGLLALPAMMKYRYDKALATGAICAGGTLGVLIPPSVLLLIYGPTAGLSVGKLFMAAFIPGLLLSLLYVIYIVVRCRLRPEMGPPLPPEAVRVPFPRKMYLFTTSILPVGALILAVLGSIFFGVAAPTEAAGIGALASMLLAAAYGKLSFANLKDAVYRTATVSAMTFMILIGAGFFTIIFVRLGGNQVIQKLLMGLPLPRAGILMIILLIVFIMGMFLDSIATIMVAVPIITPIASSLGYDPIWFAMMVSVTMQTGFLSPPFALSVFYLKGVAPVDVTTYDIYRGVLPFMAIQLSSLVVLAVFPGLITWLPNLMVK